MSFDAETEHVAFSGLELFVDSDETREGVEAFNEKRQPDFSEHRARASA